ncbi:hypothetical protein CH76_00035 [Lysinibacillus sp. BF-4]|uniref:bacillithiol biosynthesis cysteine-adding enzyme BshC n=1 Tax=Lysinibacillus sp. BF-4 TaxID=1473546 RepID=UPI0005017D7A|nr:bacillithiol biosynthesis cysteine-adding enzyme BshC [Lysinibacillus sp. BF-4]KFL44238.1 hypothetical protein CH76_00035 [Lysinibacillus sp. BF-4]
MQITAVTPPLHNQLVEDYWTKGSTLQSFFSYAYEEAAFTERLAYLQNQHYEREQLAAIMRESMSVYPLSATTEQHLTQLANGAFAIVGGQQSGVFTGPLYSVHKAITVIQLARKQSVALGVPVVPVFWIAGEDHDIEEINHTFTYTKDGLHKRKYKDRFIEKTMASTTEVTEEKLQQLIDAVIADYGEQTYTKEVIAQLRAAAKVSTTFTAFFTYLMHGLFNDAGLLWVDAANPKLRKLESAYFIRLIESAPAIAKVVTMQEERLQQAGYGTPIFATTEAANLFYVKNGARHLLTQQDGVFTTGEDTFTKAQLVDIATAHPEQLSNNVVTRPLMQEMVLPVLAFVGGPGELAYWATLKPAFDEMDLQMPIFAPRLHITLVTPHVQKQLQALQLTIEQVFAGEHHKKREAFIASVQPTEVLDTLATTKQALQANYATLLQQMPEALLTITQKNQELHLRQFDYLQRKVEQDTLIKHEVALAKYAVLDYELLPDGGLQERTYNPYQYIASCGADWINALCQQNLQTSYKHYVVSL